jgi:hypothetical protein
MGKLFCISIVWLGFICVPQLFITLTLVRAENTFIEEWNNIKAPAPAELKAVTRNPRDTVLLVLDIEERTCNSKRRPRCVASVPKIKNLLGKVRNQEMAVAYRLTRKGTPDTK